MTEGSPPERLVDLSALRCRGARAAAYEAARKAAERAALEELAAHDRDLLQELLERFAAEYADAKRRESRVDFEDLQLAARDLLRDDADVREATQLRFRLVMVDEFQDTNRLQCELIDLVAHAELTEVFTVGDEFQSIYGFRHADVEVFRERRVAGVEPARAHAELPLATAGARGREPPVRRRVRRRVPAARRVGRVRRPVFGHPVELLVTDKSSYADTASTGARARRGRSRGACASSSTRATPTPGEIVVLFAAGTDAEQYEEALRREGLPTYPRDRARLLRPAAGRRPPRVPPAPAQPLRRRRARRRCSRRRSSASRTTRSSCSGATPSGGRCSRRSSAALPEELAAGDERLLRAFLPALRAARRVPRRASGSRRSASRSLAEHDYDLAVLARWDGSRRFANLRKLGAARARLRGVRGADIAGFVRFVREQEALGARELEAVAEEEGGGAVRLLTIHAAKGLEFKVVIVADAGRDIGGPRSPDEIVALSDGRFGFRMVHPTRGKREAVFGWDAVKDARTSRSAPSVSASTTSR